MTRSEAPGRSDDARRADRPARLIDARRADRASVAAVVWRNLPADELIRVERSWAAARAALPAGAEHSHWSWLDKAASDVAARYTLVAVGCEGETQGLMAVAGALRGSALTDGRVLYIDYIEAAPWNLRLPTAAPRFIGVGAVLLSEAVRMSVEAGAGGQVGLHSLPQAERFYSRRGMTRVGTDRGYYGLAYFEYTEGQAAAFLAEVEARP